MTNDDATKLSRRQLLWKTTAGAVGLLASQKAIAAVCQDTPAQTEGPFYPVQDQEDKDNDLTRVKGRTQAATGQVIYILGTVTDDACEPVRGAVVEIWQACASGRYDHPGDTSGNPLDPNFQYWGQALTDEDGRYGLKTILPGHYYASPTWIRPPHIHYKVHAMGFHELTTQMYFKGNRYNAGDLILRDVPRAERSRVIVELADPATDSAFDAGSKVGNFDLSLVRVR